MRLAPPARRWGTPEARRAWQEHWLEALRLHESGMRIKDIGKRFGRSEEAACAWVNNGRLERYRRSTES